MRKLMHVLMGVAALPILANSAAAQTAPPAYVAQPATYSPANWPYIRPIIGFGSDSHGGTPPAFGTEPQTILSNFSVASWTVGNYFPQAAYDEAKFRTHCNYSHMRSDDPIVFPGRPGVSHLHTFYGNTLADADSTYSSLRTTGGSTCGGGQINRSAYWHPSVLKDNALGDGKTMALKPDYAVVYYNVDLRDIKRVVRIPRGFSYVTGFNMSDPADSKQKAEIAAANKLGSYSSYKYLGNGFGGWKCEYTNGATVNSPVPGSPNQPWLRNADGTATLDCPTSERIGATVVAPACWDGVNLSSPDGRSHVRGYIAENNSGQMDICPSGWFYLPTFQLTVWLSHTGPNDYKEWYLSSDRMPGMNFNNGQSFHADWFGAWDYSVMQKWMVNCTGTDIYATAGNPHSCIDSQFGDGTAGIVQNGAPDGSRSPQLNLGQRLTGVAQYEVLPGDNTTTTTTTTGTTDTSGGTTTTTGTTDTSGGTTTGTTTTTTTTTGTTTTGTTTTGTTTTGTTTTGTTTTTTTDTSTGGTTTTSPNTRKGLGKGRIKT